MSSVSAAHKKAGAMLSARSWEAMRVLSALVRAFSLQFVHQGCFSCADCLRQMSNLRGREEMPPQTGWMSIQSIFSLSICAEGWGKGSELKKLSAHQNKPCGLCCSCRVRPWTWYQSQSWSQPFALLLSNREFCIHKQKLDVAFISERHFVKAAHSWRDEEGPLLHWHQTGFGRSAQQNTAAKYTELGAHRTTNTPAEALHRQHPPCYIHQPLTDINRFILYNLAFLPAESTSWATSLLKSCSTSLFCYFLESTNAVEISLLFLWRITFKKGFNLSL